MSLTALAQQPSGTGAVPANTGDSFKHILAYFPTEVITLFVSATTLVKASSTTNNTIWIEVIFAICFLGSPVWVFVSNAQSSTKVPLPALGYRATAAALAFSTWGFALDATTPDSKLASALLLLFVPWVFQAIGTLINSCTNVSNKT